MKEIVVQNWNELQDAIFEDCWEADIHRFRNNFVFRGVDDADHPLLPKLNRVCDFDLSLEKPMLRNFRKYGYTELNGHDSFWETVSIAQHYGLPTRLLDWTYSPLVAAHFCTCDIQEYEKDAFIWCLDISKAKTYMPEPLRQLLYKENTHSFTMDLLQQVAQDFDSLKTISPDPFFLFFEPSNLFDRIANQYALFSVVSDPAVGILDLLPDQEDLIYRIRIPKEVKLEIRDKLDYINISERFIYPGLDGISQWITRRYSNLGPKYNH